MTKNTPFHERVETIRAATEKPGAVVYIKRPDGLLVPVGRSDRGPFPFKMILMVIAGLFAAKGLIFAHFGDQTVLDVAMQAEQMHKAGGVVAFLMKPDPISEAARAWLEPLVEDPTFGLNDDIMQRVMRP